VTFFYAKKKAKNICKLLYNVLHLYSINLKYMYLVNINSEKQLKSEFRKKALKLHPDLGGDEMEFVKLTQEYKFWKKKLNAINNDLSKVEVGDTVFVNKTECEVTYVDELTFIAKAKGRVKYAIFDKQTGVGKYNHNYRAALIREYFNR
jgi:hypothetical protein